MRLDQNLQNELKQDSPGKIEVKKLLEVAIRKQLKAFTLEAELSLEVGQGQVLVLFGPSGSGKTMTLRCIAGVTNPDAGLIIIGDRVVFDSRNGRNIKLSERRVGYLPQNYALFPHMTVTQNIAFGLFSQEKKRVEKRVQELLSLMQLEGLEKRYPRELSGGQQQRVAFARALAPKPDILLLDEPFSALDATIRTELRQNLAILSRELDLPVIFITHDLEEAFMLADRIAVYDMGKILQNASREEVFFRPATKEVARLVGIRNLWKGQVQAIEEQERLVQVSIDFGALWAKIPPEQPLPALSLDVTICLRPEQINLELFQEETGDKPINCYSGHIVGEVARGSLYTLFFKPQIGTENSNNYYTNRASSPALGNLELEVTAQYYNDLKRTAPTNWRVVINPSTLHLIYS